MEGPSGFIVVSVETSDRQLVGLNRAVEYFNMTHLLSTIQVDTQEMVAVSQHD